MAGREAVPAPPEWTPRARQAGPPACARKRGNSIAPPGECRWIGRLPGPPPLRRWQGWALPSIPSSDCRKEHSTFARWNRARVTAGVLRGLPGLPPLSCFALPGNKTRPSSISTELRPTRYTLDLPPGGLPASVSPCWTRPPLAAATQSLLAAATRRFARTGHFGLSSIRSAAPLAGNWTLRSTFGH